MLDFRHFYNTKKYLVAAHRGSSAQAPENTVVAFRNAINEGADIIETDIYCTRDRRIVIHHNSKVRLPNGKLVKICETDLADLKKIDVGSRFSPQFAGISIPALAELLEIAKDRIYLNIEIKPEESVDTETYISILKNELTSVDMLNQVNLATYYYNIIPAIHKIIPDAPVGGIRIPHLPIDPKAMKANFGIECYICSMTSLNRKISGEAAESDLVLGTYSVDNEKHLARAMRFGVKALGTNRPKEIVSILAQKNERVL